MILNLGRIVSKEEDKDYNPALYPTFTYTGTKSFINEGNGNWKLKLYGSGDLTFTKIGNAKYIDIYVVGGGGHGGKATAQATNYDSQEGGVGGGGDCISMYNIELQENAPYKSTIGAGGGGTSKFEYNGSLIASANGGARGGDASGNNPGANRGNGSGTRNAFGEGPNQYGYAGSGYNGYDGLTNTGNGGQGGKAGSQWDDREGGNGGSGIIIIRNHR